MTRKEFKQISLDSAVVAAVLPALIWAAIWL